MTEDLPIIYDILLKRLARGDHIEVRYAGANFTFGNLVGLTMGHAHQTQFDDDYVTILTLDDRGVTTSRSEQLSKLPQWVLKKGHDEWELTL
jgi:hypothetical protein